MSTESEKRHFIMLLNGEVYGWYDSAKEAQLAHSLMGCPTGAEIYEMPTDEGPEHEDGFPITTFC